MKPIDIQLEKYLDYCENVRRMTEQTMYSKRYILETFAKLRLVDDMQDLTNATLHRWASMQLSGALTGNKVSGRTVNIRMQHVISFCKWLRDMDYEMHVKIALIEKAEEDPPRRMFYTRDEIEFAKRYANDYERMLISLKFDSGLRIFELTNLRLQNINGRHMHIIGKGRKAGDLYMTEETRADLDKWIARNNITDYLWPSPMYKTSQPYSIDRIRDKMEHAFKHAADIAQMQGNMALAEKLRKFYPHSMRHSFATDLQESGARIDETQKLLRHSNSKTTEIYLHGLDGKLDQIYDRLKNKSGAAIA